MIAVAALNASAAAKNKAGVAAGLIVGFRAA